MTEPTDLQALAAESLADSAAWFPGLHEGSRASLVNHFVLGIGGEAGEVLDVWKKADACRADLLHSTRLLEPDEHLGLVPSCEVHAEGKHSRRALEDELADLFTYMLNLAALLEIDLVAAKARKRAELIERWGDPS